MHVHFLQNDVLKFSLHENAVKNALNALCNVFIDTLYDISEIFLKIFGSKIFRQRFPQSTRRL